MKSKQLFISVVFLSLKAVASAAVLTFEEFYAPSGDFINLRAGTPYGGVAFEFAAVANDELVAFSNHASDYWEENGTGPFLTPHSGHVALFNPIGANLNFTTDQILTGLWVARPNLGPTGIGGAEDLILTAYEGDTLLATLSFHLTSTTPAFWDTSSLLQFPGITRYTIAPAQPGKTTGYFVADDFQFASMALDELCPCEGPWRNHAEYMRCVRAAVSLLAGEGSLNGFQARDVLKDAQQSDCGKRRP